MAYYANASLAGVDRTAYTLEGVSVVYGRQRFGDPCQPTQATARFVHSTSIGTLDLDTLSLGMAFTVEIYDPTSGIPGKDHYRFYGHVTDYQVDQYTLTVNAVGVGLVAWQNQTVYVYDWRGYDPPGPYPLTPGGEETIDRLLINAQQDVTRWDGTYWATVGYTNPPSLTYRPLEPNANAQESADLGFSTAPYDPEGYDLDTVTAPLLAAEPNGVLYDDYRAGGNTVPTLRLGTFLDRNSLAADLTLQADEVSDSWTAGPDASLSCTRVVIDQGGTLYTYDSDMVAVNGVVQRTVEAATFGAASRYVLANAILSAGRAPSYWANVTVIAGTNVTDSRRETIMSALSVGACIHTPTLHPDLPTVWYLEGYTEQISARDYTIALRLSDPSVSYTGQPWQNVTAALTWGAVNASTTWNTLRSTNL